MFTSRLPIHFRPKLNLRQLCLLKSLFPSGMMCLPHTNNYLRTAVRSTSRSHDAQPRLRKHQHQHQQQQPPAAGHRQHVSHMVEHSNYTKSNLLSFHILSRFLFIYRYFVTSTLCNRIE